VVDDSLLNVVICHYDEHVLYFKHDFVVSWSFVSSRKTATIFLQMFISAHLMDISLWKYTGK
jgi:hypothetical protein